ncbi:type VI secretion system baseplate subunit TssF [Moellerella wisconsensis]|uniref:Type VI secretion system baseplate subunit TssF n=1 Tax=Moellerella wisconsensis TaxID=158849 RepID=A0A9Q8Q043_9GAMM|nr:type VI secretion system baseplate subunit TssF [Moellerella wisconsensis]UNH29817.1 type VI secretion system baseplate subunit TssF [Moellerella wisconsensis]
MKSESILAYFEKQITHLQNELYNFAKEYPEAADALGINHQEITDPQIKYLIDSVAYLNARIEQRLDDHYPEFTEHMLGLIYPHYLCPTPAICMMEFIPDAKMIAGQKIVQGSLFSGNNKQGQEVIFRQATEVTIYPIELTSVSWLSPPFSQYPTAACAIQLTISLLDKGNNISQYNISELNLHLNGHDNIIWRLYDLLSLDSIGFEVKAKNHQTKRVKSALVAEDISQLVANNKNNTSFPGWTLLHDAFLFPVRYLSFRLNLAESLQNINDHECSIIIYFSCWPDELVNQVNKDNISLFSCAGINLFPYLSEPMAVDFTKKNYKLFLDPQKDLLLHSIDNVQDITSDSLFNIPQLYRESYDEINHPSSLAYDWRWNISHQKSVGMAELSVSGSNNIQGGTRIWQINAQVTQHKQATEMHKYSELSSMDTLGFTGKLKIKTKPLIGEMIHQDSDAILTILSHFRANLTSLLAADNPAEKLQQWLLQYDRQYNHQLKTLIKSIHQVSSKRCVSPVKIGKNRLYFSGFKIVVTLNLTEDWGGVSFLGQVLQHFLASLTDDTVFIQLSIHTEGVIHRKIDYLGKVGCQTITAIV